MPIISTYAAMSNRGWYNINIPAGSWYQQQKINGNIQNNNYFGWSGAINDIGNIVLIGAPYEDIGANSDQGAAYVFSYNGTTWSQQQKLTANDGASNDRFGYSSAFNSIGNIAIIGADLDDIGANVDQGSAYIFSYNGTTWSQQQKLTASDGTSGHGFGSSVAINAIGNIAIIGSPAANIGALTNRGAAYIFTYNGTTWSQQQKLTASDAASGDNFGTSVAINSVGNVVIIGSNLDDIGANSNQGSAYVFTYNGTTWSQQQKLTASDGLAGDGFGSALNINSSGNIAIITSTGDDITLSNEGSAYVFTYNGTTWSQQQKLIANDIDNINDYNFGWDCDINDSGNIIIIGAPYYTNYNSGQDGAAYVFTYNGTTWSQQQKLIASDSGAQFGFSVNLNSIGNTTIIGELVNVTAPSPGAAYIFKNSN